MCIQYNTSSKFYQAGFEFRKHCFSKNTKPDDLKKLAWFQFLRLRHKRKLKLKAAAFEPQKDMIYLDQGLIKQKQSWLFEEATQLGTKL